MFGLLALIVAFLGADSEIRAIWSLFEVLLFTISAWIEINNRDQCTLYSSIVRYVLPSSISPISVSNNYDGLIGFHHLTMLLCHYPVASPQGD